MSRTTITDLADACGVSTATVSRVFNNRNIVDAETREKILTKALEVGYSPKLTARKDCIGIIVEQYNQISSSGYDSMAIAALSEAIFKEGIRLEILPITAASVIREKFYLGIISCLYNDSSLKLFRGIKKVPKVELNSIHNDDPSIVSDDVQGIKIAIDYFISLGHQRIGFIGKKLENYNSSSRLSAFSMAIKNQAALLPVQGFSHLIDSTDGVLDATARLMREGVTSILCSSEELGPPVSHALFLLGKQIPGDISIISFETQGVSQYLTPAHTTIGQNFITLAQNAVQILIEGSKKQSTQIKGLVKNVPYTFILRESTGAKK